MFDRRCLGIKCSACDKDWHTECCNLTGITTNNAKKLEKLNWRCPWCDQPGIENPDSKAGKDTEISLKSFMSSIARVKSCTEELNEGITSVEFFNQHVKHLLLEKYKFKEHCQDC